MKCVFYISFESIMGGGSSTSSAKWTLVENNRIRRFLANGCRIRYYNNFHSESIYPKRHIRVMDQSFNVQLDINIKMRPQTHHSFNIKIRIQYLKYSFIVLNIIRTKFVCEIFFHMFLLVCFVLNMH